MSSTAAIHVVLTQDFLAARGQRAGFLLLGGFLVWVFIRTSARLIRNPKITWWPGSVHTKGGLHIHHLVWGIVVVLISGFLNFALSPGGVWLDVLAVLFGIGAGLTLDEYVLWLRLDDVYWSEEGRSSVDAVIAAATTGAMVLVAVPRIKVSGSAIATVAPVALILTYCVICLLKGKIKLGLTGLFLPGIALVGAVRLAKPSSPWARWRYPQGSPKLARARARFERMQGNRRRFEDLIAGAPSKPAANRRAAAPNPAGAEVNSTG